MSGVSRQRFLQGAAGGGAVVAAGAVAVSRLARGEGEPGLLPWRGPRQAGITTPRTDHAIVAAFDVVDDDLAGLLRDLTARIAELTQGRPRQPRSDRQPSAPALGHR